MMSFINLLSYGTSLHMNLQAVLGNAHVGIITRSCWYYHAYCTREPAQSSPLYYILWRGHNLQLVSAFGAVTGSLQCDYIHSICLFYGGEEVSVSTPAASGITHYYALTIPSSLHGSPSPPPSNQLPSILTTCGSAPTVYANLDYC